MYLSGLKAHSYFLVKKKNQPCFTKFSRKNTRILLCEVYTFQYSDRSL